MELNLNNEEAKVNEDYYMGCLLYTSDAADE